ncbi:hypothetical protein [Streptomyces clavuligerus]|uniref:Uncharacterized protein n=1 Tax=Streptomyces clavuligerus TaxID=1901 RepID=B5H0K3_STRCL|nr:hypothetical protein [Streptomyces clavuligerus]ANW18890.1 hypothetical protein BB341_11940 [Streptomyces clavuligerus]AXU13466.1 hypothetical protein D1794_12370 [Streptomyces clavuligerus]EDY52099.1 hypothetical protein SSCG_05167 [Streptomyces clavuligerus]EFG08407.1 Hypothetical protein SCLAV_3336 [Streptomyces clavuligerus]MBY6303424.1 hypothetical protein [Streptomyces clavuligerus]
MFPPNYRVHETSPLLSSPTRHEALAAWAVNRTLGSRVELVDFPDDDGPQVYLPLTVSDGSMGRPTGLYLATHEAEALASELIEVLRAANESRRRPREFRRNQAAPGPADE